MGADFITYIAKEWHVIGQAPVTFLAAIIVVAGLLYWVMNWRYDAIISALNGRIGLRDDQIAQLKEKVGTASPDEIKARIDRLEAQVHGMAPRRLTNPQKAALSDALKRQPGKIQISSDVAAGDSRAFSGDLINAFQTAGWHIQNAMVMGPGNPSPHGLSLTVENPEALTPHQALIVQAFRANEIVFDLQQGPVGMVIAKIPNTLVQPLLDATLLISQKII
jgi:hypothetical protein